MVVESFYHKGEHCAHAGQFHDALANFQKAKSLLLSQSYQHSSSSSMEKISMNIKKYTEVLAKNPILALCLSRGYNSDDLKKQYRTLALQFHPGNLLINKLTMYV